MNSPEQKINETIAELQEWLNKPGRKKEDHDDLIDNINEELGYEQLRKSVRLPFEYLNNWYNSNFVYDLLTTGKTDYKLDAAANGYQNLVIADNLAKQYPNNPPKVPFDKAAYWLANCLSQKWYDESETLIKIINSSLSTKVLNGGLDFKIASWFILEVLNKGYQLSTDLPRLIIPKIWAHIRRPCIIGTLPI